MRELSIVSDKYCTMKVLCIFVSLVVVARCDYHEEVGIALAARIKEYEDKIFGNTPEMESRLHNSEEVPDGGFPYVGALLLSLKNGHLSCCGSSLISPIRLVTSGHCLVWVEVVTVRLGSAYLYHGGVRYPNATFKIHPQYDRTVSRNHDIGLVKLQKAVTFSDVIKAIDLPWREELYEKPGEWALTVGWGITANRIESDKPRGLLRQVDLMIVPEAVCMKAYANLYRTTGDTICTSGDANKGVCDGDSGGPLVVMREGRRVIVGVAAYGDLDACNSFKPSVFIKVSNYLKFLESE